MVYLYDRLKKKKDDSGAEGNLLLAGLWAWCVCTHAAVCAAGIKSSNKGHAGN